MNATRFCGLRLPRNFLHFFQLNRAARNIFCSVERDTVRRRALPTHCRSFFSVQPLPGKSCALGSVAIVSRICFVSAGAKRGRCRRFGDRSSPRAHVRYRREPSPSRTRRTGRSARPSASRSSAGWRFDKAPKIAHAFTGGPTRSPDAANRRAPGSTSSHRAGSSLTLLQGSESASRITASAMIRKLQFSPRTWFSSC